MFCKILQSLLPFILCIIFSCTQYAYGYQLPTKNPEIRQVFEHGKKIVKAQRKLSHFILVFENENKALRYKLPKKYKLVRKWGKYLVVSSHKKLSYAVERELSSVEPKPIQIAIDSIWRFDFNLDDPSPVCNAINVGTDAIFQVLGTVRKLVIDCSFSEKCPITGESLDWDKMLVNIDLMQSELKRMDLSKSNTTVAVVDSAIDVSAEQHIDASFKWPNDWYFLDPKDKSGHGTFVASRIAQVIPGAEIRSFNVESDNDEILSGSVILEKLELACKNGNEVINLSIGDTFAGLKVPMELTMPLISKLKNKGCLVVKSAGNDYGGSDQINAIHTIERQDKLFEIGSISYSGEKSKFSSAGMLYAPGDRVRGYLPPNSSIQNLINDEKGYSCDSSTVFLPGTSFAAPVVSGISKLVFDILKTSPQFKNILPSVRVDMVQSIIEQSSVQGVVDGLRAILMAEAVSNSKNLDAIHSTGAYIELYLNSPTVKTLLSKNLDSELCHDIIDCQEQENCIIRKRTFYSVDGTSLSSSLAAKDIFKSYHNAGEFELAYSWLKRISPEDLVELSKTLDWGAFDKRISKLTDLLTVSNYLADLVHVPQMSKNAVWERFKKQILFEDRNFPDGSHLEYLVSVADPMLKLGFNGNYLLQEILQKPADIIDDRALSLGLYLASKTDTNLNVSFIQATIAHSNSGMGTLLFAAKAISNSVQADDVNDLIVSLLGHKELNDILIGRLIENLAKANYPNTLKTEQTDKILLHKKSKSFAIALALKNAINIYGESSDLIEKVSELVANLEKQNDEEDIKSAAFTAAFSILDALSPQEQNNFLREILNSKLASPLNRMHLIYRSGLDSFNSEQLEQYWIIIAKSNSGFGHEPMGGLEAFTFINDEGKLDVEQKLRILKEFGDNGLPPRNIMKHHLERSKYPPSDQALLLTVYK